MLYSEKTLLLYNDTILHTVVSFLVVVVVGVCVHVLFLKGLHSERSEHRLTCWQNNELSMHH